MFKFWKRKEVGAVRTVTTTLDRGVVSPSFCAPVYRTLVNSPPVNMTARKLLPLKGQKPIPPPRSSSRLRSIALQQQQQQQHQKKISESAECVNNGQKNIFTSNVCKSKQRKELFVKSFRPNISLDADDIKILNTNQTSPLQQHHQQQQQRVPSVSTSAKCNKGAAASKASNLNEFSYQPLIHEPHVSKKYIQFYRAEDFLKLQILGEGTYGIVHKCIHKKTNRLMAMKMLRLALDDSRVAQCALREISLLSQMQHLNIVRMMGLIKEEYGLGILFEHLDMDLRQYLNSLAPNSFLHETTVRQYMYQLTAAIEYCHNRKIMHRDLKPSNLLIDAGRKVIKVADFGLGRSFSIPVGAYTNEVVTMWYRAPELLFGEQKYTCAIDIWSIGCIFAEMANKRPLFPGRSEIHQIKTIFCTLGAPTVDTWPDFQRLLNKCPIVPQTHNFQLHRYISYLGEEGFNLLFRILAYDPLNRLTATDILHHRYFNDLCVPLYYGR